MLTQSTNKPKGPGKSSVAAQGVQQIPKKSQQIKTDKPRPHVCTVCTRAFARLEHLKRHERSHTNEKPFQCAACGRCFARRDLVLRHQQKLHSSLPNILRRGSAKDNDQTEHINILHNNTDAKAPLPGARLSFDGNSNKSDSPKQSQLYSPPRTNELGLNGQSNLLRNSLFNHQYGFPQSGSPNNVIPSPIPTHSNQNTPPMMQNSAVPNNSIENNQNLSPQTISTGSPKKAATNKNINPNFAFTFTGPMQGQQQFRHASFSAASGASYTNMKDAITIQQNNAMLEAPFQVDFATPQPLDPDNLRSIYGDTDLNSLDIDWNGIDSLDLGSSLQGKMKNSNSTLDLAHLSSKQRSMKNMQQYFDLNVIATHQFQNPNHPHHIKGTTPFEFGMNPPNDFTAMPHMNNEVLNGASFNLNKNAIDDKKSKKEQIPKSENSKRIKLENTIPEEDWLKDIINTPYELNFPTASHNVGFSGFYLGEPSPNSQNDDISSLFKYRQMDLAKQMNISPTEVNSNGKRSSNDIGTSEVNMNDIEKQVFFSKRLRDYIMRKSNLKEDQFPPIEDMNRYLKLYEREFNKYFPFIHLPTLKNPMTETIDNLPLLLSMSAIGALYSHHSLNVILLFNLSKVYIQSFFENEISLDNIQVKPVPLMSHQCLVLHIFISLFLNEPKMAEITTKQIKSTIGFILSTNFNKPIEQISPPPPNMASYDPTVVQKNFNYFIEAQSRIRTIHVFHMLEVFRSCLLGTPITFPFSEIKSGSYCAKESLWRSENPTEWLQELKASNFDLREPITNICNGKSTLDLIDDLRKHNMNNEVCSNNLLSLLLYIHEKIQEEQSKMMSKEFSMVEWRLKARPKLEVLIKSWEYAFIRKGGSLLINDINKQFLNTREEFGLILPLYFLAKIRLAINITSSLKNIFSKNWKGMNDSLKKIADNKEELRESVDYALDILRLWVYNISVVSDAKMTSLRTPVLFVSCAFVSILVMATYLNLLEDLDGCISAFDKVKWLQCQELLSKIEYVLAPHYDNNSFSDFLKVHLDETLEVAVKHRDISKLISLNAPDKKILEFFKSICLGSKCLYIGIRVLADVPVWPVSMTFADALKHRAIDLKSTTN
ncbi:uncharacterized protein PRCAT00003978001 [Priceomyces carsonii]|uniref:uncharacterized protein n=1 Tax=Priceomyces carsonii TaxID=28549 RepID=UPI002ED9E3E2|nr:unnamed protein product [Priceomyces carsonii]